jgi:protein-S-isoprenylcysteine O-methyltransferase Ste14
MHQLLAQLLPGFTWITWPSFFLGLFWSFVYGWYICVRLAKSEERDALAEFGDAYRRYMAEVPGWIPSLRRLFAQSEARG